MTTPAEGWYPDPIEPGKDRWWAGTEWSDDVRPSQVSPPPPPAPYAPMQPAPPAQTKKSGCLGVGMGVMFGILGAVVLLVGGCVAIFANAADDAVESIEAVASSLQTTTTEGKTGSTTAAAAGESTTSPGQPGEGGDKCTIVGVDSFDDIQVTLEVTSPFDTDSATMAITYSLIGADGIRFDTSTAYPEFVGPREFIVVNDDSIVSAGGRSTDGMTCQILNIEQF